MPAVSPYHPLYYLVHPLFFFFLSYLYCHTTDLLGRIVLSPPSANSSTSSIDSEMARVDLEKYYAGNREETVPSHSNISSQQLSEDSNPNSAPSTNERPIHGLKWALAVTSILWVDFLFAMDNTIVSCSSFKLQGCSPRILNYVKADQRLACKCTAKHPKHLWRNREAALGRSELHPPIRGSYPPLEQGLLYLQHQMALHYARRALRGRKRPHRGCAEHECLHYCQGYGWLWKLWNVYR